MPDTGASPNHILSTLLAEAGWSPRVLARQINGAFGPGSVSPTAPYHWRDTGALPRDPLPVMAAAVLSRHLGRPIAPREIWPGHTSAEAARVELASHGLIGPWNRDNALAAVTADLAGGEMRRRALLAVSGTALMSAVWGWLDAQAAPPGSPPPPDLRGEPLIEHIEMSIPLLQRLDDAHGGAAHLSYVEAQLHAVGLVLREHEHTEATVRHLLAAAATLGQLCGWMALDAGEDGVAQRHWFTALRAAREIGDRPLAAHILADLAFQAASSTANVKDALVLGEAAARTVRASVASRLAFAYAAAGRRAEFDHTRDLALSALEQRNDAREPAWMYFLTDSHLDCQAGYALIALGRRQLALGDHDGRRDLERGNRLLYGGAHTVPADDPSQRRALYEGAWLALGHAALGDNQQACALADAAASRLKRVRSPRSTRVLEQVATNLRTRRRNSAVRDFLPAFEHALTRAAR
jgi:hypothetical protein